MLKFIVIPPNGEITEINPTDESQVLAAWYEATQCDHVEMISSTMNDDMWMITDGYVKFKTHERNERATGMIVGLLPGDYIGGTAVLIGRADREGNTTDCPLTLAEVQRLWD